MYSRNYFESIQNIVVNRTEKTEIISIERRQAVNKKIITDKVLQSTLQEMKQGNDIVIDGR